MLLPYVRKSDVGVLIRATGESAGIDLCSIHGGVIMVGSKTEVRLGVKVELPPLHFGLLCLRSSVGREGVCIPGGIGVIDADYRGELRMFLTSVLGKLPYEFDAGWRCAQLIVVPFVRLEPREVDKLSETDRGEGGFGSTG